jgi:hypothetical protein
LHLGPWQLLARTWGGNRGWGLTSLQGRGELELQRLGLRVEGRADSRGPQVLHQLGLGTSCCVVLNAVVTA